MTRSTPAPSIETPSESEMDENPFDDPVDGTLALVDRTRVPEAEDTLNVKLCPLPAEAAMIVSVQPPKLPETGLDRVHTDIVLVIDVSVSMAESAPLPDVADESAREATGLSILDLTKHAARTVLNTLKDGDRLAIVTFSEDAEIIQHLTHMTAPAKKKAWERINTLRTKSNTNLWSGIKAGLKVVEYADTVGNVQGIYVLTDGMPNYMCPPKGYVKTLGPMLHNLSEVSGGECQPTIHTFGFGYSIRSDLMSSIAEVGNGSYAFISDAGMIGTVFVHAAANLLTTFARSASLTLTEVSPLFSSQLVLTPPEGTPAVTHNKSLILKLGNLQYGQSRDIWIWCPGIRKDTVVQARLDYQLPVGGCRDFRARCSLSEQTDLSRAQIDYHRYRSEICRFLSSLFPLKPNGEHGTIDIDTGLPLARIRLNSLVARLRAAPDHSGGVDSLIADLVGEDPAGQVSLAMSKKTHWQKWGRHYLPSLLHAHQRQMCNTFKDPGPLLYGKDSPLFIQCRDDLDAAFDSLPAPKPSRPPPVITTVDDYGRRSCKPGEYSKVSMSSYNSNSNPCFEGNCFVTLANGSGAPVKSLQPGTSVWTPMGARPVAAVLRTRVRRQDQKLCQIGELLVTPWHPIKHGGEWQFPAHVAESTIGFQGDVYSVLLSPSRHADAHAIEVGGQICVTLGHGIVKSPGDVRAHAFFGNYRRITMSLSRLAVDKNNVFQGAGLQRDRKTGLACGFARAAAANKRVVLKGTRRGGRLRARVRA